MTTKAEWMAAMSSERGVGAPPAFDEAMAYMRGELAPDEEARVRAQLVAHPELLRVLTTPFTEESVLSGAELAQEWGDLQRRLPRRNVSHFWQAFGAIAATLAVVFATLFVNERSKLREEMLQPRVAVDPQGIVPGGQRGGGSDGGTVLESGTAPHLITGAIPDSTAFATYRFEIVEAATQRSIWKSEPVQAKSETFALTIPRKRLPRGRYDVVLYGVTGTSEVRITAYSFTVS
jgi:hypothetical protein